MLSTPLFGRSKGSRGFFTILLFSCPEFCVNFDHSNRGTVLINYTDAANAGEMIGAENLSVTAREVEATDNLSGFLFDRV